MMPHVINASHMTVYSVGRGVQKSKNNASPKTFVAKPVFTVSLYKLPFFEFS